MKRLITLFCSCLLILECFIFVPHVNAEEHNIPIGQVLISENIEYLDDGMSIVTSVYEDLTFMRSNLYNKSGSKIYRFRNADGEVLWTLTIHGEFRIIEGASVTCISATCSAEVYDPNWSCTRKSALPSGSWAIANGEFERSLLGIVVSRESVEVSLTSDVYGNLS